MSKTYFVVSDIHSFATELKAGLRIAGYQKRNKDHVLIVCGDVFDRGEETLEVYKYLKSIPKSRCVLIKGNHESLFDELLAKTLPDDYDFSNGTVSTFCQIAGISEEVLSRSYYYKLDGGAQCRNRILRAWSEIKTLVRASEIYDWLHSKQWNDYYELDRFIFVHSFIPLRVNDIYSDLAEDEYNPYWREASVAKWEDARWGCPWRQYLKGYFKPEADKGKTLVCGHWHTDDFFLHLKNVYGSGGEIYYSEHLIGIDGGVRLLGWMTKKLVHDQNVLIIKDGKCYDTYQQELHEIEAKGRIETISAK